MNHTQMIGGTQSGKTAMWVYMQNVREHPNGVVKGEVVTDSGEISNGTVVNMPVSDSHGKEDNGDFQ
jgi:hypothetical protein